MPRRKIENRKQIKVAYKLYISDELREANGNKREMDNDVIQFLVERAEKLKMDNDDRKNNS